jgi:hypothetical protein
MITGEKEQLASLYGEDSSFSHGEGSAVSDTCGLPQVDPAG